MKKEKLLSLLGLGVAFCLAKPHLLYANSSFGGGSGTEQDPYRLSTPEHLTELQVAVDGGNSFSGKYFVLTDDIDFVDYDDDNDPSNGNFTPIGYWNSNLDYAGFSGNLNGNHHSISNLQIILPDEYIVGLFTFLENGKVSNLNLKQIVIQGSECVGGIVGYAEESTIEQSSASGKILGMDCIGGLAGELTGSIIKQSSVSGDVSGDWGVGGLVGCIEVSIIEQSSASGEVSGSESVGGLMGLAQEVTINQSYASGEVLGERHVGGIIGESYSDTTIEHSFATGGVTGVEFVGGLIGYSSGSAINTSFFSGNVLGEEWVGGLVGTFDYSVINHVYVIGDVEGINCVGGLIGHDYYSSSLKNAYHVGTVTGTAKVGRIIGRHEDTSVIENVYYNQEENTGLPLIGLDESTIPLGDIVGLTLNQMSQTNSQNYMSALDFENIWTTTSTTPMFQWQKDLVSATEGDIQIRGTIQAVIADVSIPSVSPDLVIDPNSPEGAISPEFSIENQSTSPIRLELKTFEQTTHSFNDVLPEKYDSWEGLNKTQSQDIALGLVAKEGNGWQQLTTPASYVANHTEHEIGVIKPTSQVNFEFDVHHGRAFSESKTVQHKLVFVFDLLS